MRRHLWFFRHLYTWTQNWAERPSAAWALLGFAWADNFFFPVPSEVLQYALYVSRPERAFWYSAIVVAGTALGAATGYGIGHGLAELAGWMLGAFGQDDLGPVRRWLRNNVFWAVFLGSLTPFSDKLLVLGSGMLGAPCWVFLPAYTLGRAVRTYPVALLFWAFGSRLQPWIERYVEIVSAIFTILFTVLVMVFVLLSV